MNLTSELNCNLQTLQSEIKRIEQEISNSPAGHMTQEIHQGKPVLVAVCNKDGRRTRRTLPQGSCKIREYLHKIVLSEKLDILRKNEKILSRTLSSIKEPDTFSMLPVLMSKFPLIPEAELLRSFDFQYDSDEWAAQPFEQSDYKLEAKTQITSRGLCVRSKSEILIAEILYDYGLSFRYEQVLHFEAYTMVPDYTIRRADGKIFYWEHMGLMYSKEYRDHQIWKLQNYINNGITPWDNLIITFDNAQGSVDTRIIRSEIENKLLKIQGTKPEMNPFR